MNQNQTSRPPMGGGPMGHGPRGMMIPGGKARDFKGTLQKTIRFMRSSVPVILLEGRMWMVTAAYCGYILVLLAVATVRYFRQPRTLRAVREAKPEKAEIVLWVLASLADARYVSVVVCFAAFLANDVYGYVNWQRIKIRQKAGDAAPERRSKAQSWQAR